ncbi:TonB-dependent receptor [Kordiimonas sediminis]|uniref:TonB-dependent receptor n=1 Tax=Kordiimonas sediminis TaxID=1735581 RepID=A0A919AXG5_9PROT|nr:TonB-dependent receptor [Kordiimonas sediminis]GHF31093.1 TonB-dependent receptor [Kordiimonas sediminis]
MTTTLRKSAMMLAAGTSFAALSTGAFAQADSVTLEEIVVTAQKREQSLQDVPISVTTMRGEKYDNFAAGGGDIRLLAARIPGLNAESSNGRVAPRFYIRGLGNTDFDLAASQPVSIIMDEVVMERVVLKSFPLFDVERIEVLRGPQGTLFGRNTPAGIVKFDSVKPGDEVEGYLKASYGSRGTRSIRTAATLPVSDTFSVRVSGLYAGRDDWIDNGYTGQDDAMGGFEDVAGRVIARFSPNENFEALLNVHARTLDGTATIFRANVLTTGSNELNDNYDRDTVYFDEGDNNPQEYDNFGANLKLTYDMDTVSLTSITAFEQADGRSLGDIDGGYGAVYLPEMGPGVIPFNSQTQDSVDDLDQFTQEFRLASNTDEALQWQAGFYYFKDDLTVSTNPFFTSPSTVTHENEAWSLFGQVSYDTSDATTVTVGVRYTDDQKDLDAVNAVGVIFTEEASADRLSWDIAVNHIVDDNLSVYTRLAQGFRAPSIQGRDIAFFAAPSVAKEEVITSGEVGFKSTLNDNRVRLNGSVYYWQMKDQQLTAVGGTNNLIQLVNADKTVGYGFETDLEWLASENLSFTAGISYNKTKLKDDTLAVGTCGSGMCTVVNSLNADGFALVDGNALPQAPLWLVNFTATYTYPVSDSSDFFFTTDWFLEGKKNLFLYETREYYTNGDFEGGVRMGLTFNDGQYEVAVFGRNITNESNLKGGIDFNNNTAFVNEPRTWGLALSAKF